MDLPVSKPEPQPSAPAAPRVSVIVTGYGVADMLGEALESLKAQTFTDWECVVIDDGAPDDVAGAVAPFLADPRFRFLATDNRGVSTARNRAVAASHGALIAILDGDDKFRPEYLATMAPLLDDPAIRIATCNARHFGAIDFERYSIMSHQGHGDGVRGGLIDVLDRSFSVYIGSMFRRADFDAIGGFDEAMTHAEDLDLWVRLMQLGGTIHYADQVLADYRIRGDSASGKVEPMLRGNLRVYEKARAALVDDRPEVAMINAMIAEQQRALAFEATVSKIIAGDTRTGLPELRRNKGDLSGLMWTAIFAAWRVLPWLAPPMLRLRRQRHARGYTSGGGSALQALFFGSETLGF